MGKSELAHHLGIHVSTLQQWRRRCDPQLAQALDNYNPRACLLSPIAVEIILRHHGVIR